MYITAAQKTCCCFCLHYSCMAMRSADESEYCGVSMISLDERVKFTWYITLLMSTSSSDERCLEKLFNLWDALSLLSHRHHSDGVLMHLEIAAIICFGFFCPRWASFHTCATARAPFYTFYTLRLGWSPSKIGIWKGCNISSLSQFTGIIMWLTSNFQVWVTFINYSCDSHPGVPKRYFCGRQGVQVKSVE